MRHPPRAALIAAALIAAISSFEGCARRPLAFLSDPAYEEIRGGLVSGVLALRAPGFGYDASSYVPPAATIIGDAYKYLDFRKPSVCFLSPAFQGELAALARAYPGTRFVQLESGPASAGVPDAARVAFAAKGAFSSLGSLMARYLAAWKGERGDATYAACVSFARGGSTEAEVEALRAAYLAAGGDPAFLALARVDPDSGIAEVKAALFQKNVSIAFVDRGPACLDILEQAPWPGALFCLRDSADLAEFRDGVALMVQDDFEAGIVGALESGAAPRSTEVPALLAMTTTGRSFKIGTLPLGTLLEGTIGKAPVGP